MPDTLQTSDRPPTFAETISLPRWMQLALAWRCAMRLEPTYRALLAPNNLEIVRSVLDSIKRAVESGIPPIDLPDMRTEANNLMDDRACEFEALDDRSRFERRLATSDAVSVVVNAMLVAKHSSSPDTMQNRAQALNMVIDDAESAAFFLGYQTEVANAISFDTKQLITALERGGWSDATPVNLDLFGPLWPLGVPDGWPNICQRAIARRD